MFPVAVARLWNSLPSHVTAAPSLSIFCCLLKSHLFSLSYPAFWLFSHLYSARTVTRHFGHYKSLLHLTSNVYGADIMTQSHCESSPGSRDDCRTASGGCRPLDQANGLEPQARLQAPSKLHPPSPLLSPKADTHFTVPHRVESWVHLDDWPTKTVLYVKCFMVSSKIKERLGLWTNF